MHPCFSDEFCFDAVPRRIARKGIFTDVLVMSKNKLAEYEGKRRFSGNGFKLEGEKHHRFFIDKKFALTIWMIFACLLVAAGGLLCGVIAGKLSNQKNLYASEVAAGVVADVEAGVAGNAMGDAASENTYEETPFTGELLIKAVAEASGKITNFEWSLEGFTETLNASVEGVYPEGLEKSLVPQNITYVNGIPRFVISSMQKINIPVVEVLPSTQNVASFNVQIRKLITENKGEIQEERTIPYRVLFSCDSKDSAGKLFSDLSDFIEENKLNITYIRLTQTAKLLVELSLESIPVKGFDLKLIDENLNLFFEEKSINQKNAAQVASVKGAGGKSAAKPQVPLNKIIGEIKRSDNSTIVFYKNQEGKLEKMLIAEEKNHD